MEGIGLNHWFINDNTLSISLMRYVVLISMLQREKDTFFRLEIQDSAMERMTLYFMTLEEAIWFTENVINKCDNERDIIAAYKSPTFCDEKRKTYKKREK